MRAFNLTATPPPRQRYHLPSWTAGPIDLEVGAGQGLHAIRYCASNPNRQLIAIERTEKKFSALKQRKIRHPELSNLTILHADAVSVLAYDIPDGTFSRIFLLYPNPYPKKKQSNLRWHQSPAMKLLLDKAKAKAEIHLATNLQWYADEAETFMTTTWNLRLLSRRSLNDSIGARTHFERKYLLRGETCHDLVFQLQ